MEFAWWCQAKLALCHVNAILHIWVRIDMYLEFRFKVDRYHLFFEIPEFGFKYFASNQGGCVVYVFTNYVAQSSRSEK